MIYITSIVSTILIISCFIKKNSKKLFIGIFIWMWIIFTFSYGNADYDMYVNLYKGQLVNKVEIGFTFICKIFNQIGIPYHVFLGIYGFIGLSLIALTIYKLSDKISLNAALYFIFPFIFDVIQIRNFMAMALIIYGINFIIRNNKYDWIKYYILNIIAITFHNIAIICLIFPILNYISKKKLYQLCIVGGILEFFVIINKKFLINILSIFLKQQKVEAYFESNVYAPRNFNNFKINYYLYNNDINC